MKSLNRLFFALMVTAMLTATVSVARAQSNTTPVTAAQAQAAPDATATQVPQPADNGVNWPGAGYGAAALVGNLLYIPAKMTYAILGSIVGGGTYAVTGGNTQASNTVFRSALGGDYVLTPQMIAGDKPIYFSGPTTTPPADPSAPAPGAQASPMGSSNVAPIQPLSSSSGSSMNSASASKPMSSAMPMDKTAAPSAAASSSIE